jgi:hypothetical protein
MSKQMPTAVLWSLSHHVDVEWLLEAYHRTRKDGALGIDGQSAQEYAKELGNHLQSLLNRAKSGNTERLQSVGTHPERRWRDARWAFQRSRTRCCSAR